MDFASLREKFKLSSAEFDEIQNLIIEIYTANVKPSTTPVAIILGGQPGAGKSELITAVHRLALISKEGIVICNADDYRDYHPKSDEIKEVSEEFYPEITVEYSHPWNLGLRRYCEDNRLNYTLETTFSSGEVMNDTIKEIKEKGYQVLIMLLAVHEKWSLLGTYLRYEDMKLNTGYGRMVTKEQHDNRYNQIPVTLKAVQDAGLCEHIMICSRTSPEAESNGRGVYLVADNPVNPLQTYLEVRDKYWSQESKRYFEESCRLVIKMMKERNANENIEQFCANMAITKE